MDNRRITYICIHIPVYFTLYNTYTKLILLSVNIYVPALVNSCDIVLKDVQYIYMGSTGICLKYKHETKKTQNQYSSFRSGRYWEMVQRQKITHFYTAPTALRLLLKAGDDWVHKYDRSSLRILGCGKQ